MSKKSLKESLVKFKTAKREIEEDIVEDTFSEEELEEMDNNTVVNNSNSDAARTLVPNSAPVNDPKTRLDYMLAILGQLGEVDNETMVKFYNDMLDQFGAGKDDADAPDGADAKNRATVAMKGAVKEEFSKLFSADETLTEESKDKLSTLFEAAVNSQVSIALEEIRADVATKINELEEAYAEVVEEEVAEITEGLAEQVDDYINYATEQWIEENSLAVESGIRTEIAASFINDLRDLFIEHNINIPEDQVEVVDQLANEVEELQAAVNEAIKENNDLKAQIVENVRKETLVNQTDGLTEVQKENFLKLAEGVEFDGDIEVYTKKLSTVKEGFLASTGDKKSPTKTALVEETSGFDVAKTTSTNPDVALFAKALSRVASK